MKGLRTSTRRGTHYELAVFAAKRLAKQNFMLKVKNESDYEMVVTTSLGSSRKLRPTLITQKDTIPVEKITTADVFGFKHHPDLTIGNDGTAIELKVIQSGHSIREAIGQALCYRTHYRFAIMALMDLTKDRLVVNRCADKNSPAHKLLKSLCDECGIFTIVGPMAQRKNVAFIP